MSLAAAWKRKALMYRAELAAEQRRSQSYRWHLDRIARARATTTEYYHHRMQLYRAHCQRRLLAASEAVREYKTELNAWALACHEAEVRARFLTERVEELEAENARLRAIRCTIVGRTVRPPMVLEEEGE